MDFTLLKDLNDFAARHDGFEDIAGVIAQNSEWVFIGLLAVLFLATGKWESRNARHGVVAAGLAAALALAVAHGITMLWDRPRPFETHRAVHLFVSHAGDPSFPSDHATAGFAIAVSLLLRSRRVGIFALVLAAAMAASRVVIGVHYPSDVVAGACLGTASALFFWLEPVRSRLDRLADWAGGVYEAGADRILRRPAHASG
jgi:undecaprenyl-diphosphatase